MWFKRWNIVIAKVNKDPSIEAVVDFETKDGKVYISEWWRPLTYPTRLIVDSDKLFLKDKQIKIWRQQMQWLIREFFREDLDFLNLRGLDSLKIWDKLKWNQHNVILLNELNWLKVVWTYIQDYDNGRDYIDHIYWLTQDELKSSVHTKEEIIHTIFWDSVKEKDVVIVDDTTWEPL